MPQHWSRAARAGGRGGSRQEFEAFEEQQLVKAPAWQRRCLRGTAEGRLARLGGELLGASGSTRRGKTHTDLCFACPNLAVLQGARGGGFFC